MTCCVKTGSCLGRLNLIENTYHLIFVLKVLVPIHSLIPQLFSNTWRFWYQKLSHIQKALCVTFWRNQRKTLLKIRKTISSINIVFSNCLQMRYIFAMFSPWIMFWQKIDQICQFKENSFPKISEQAPLRFCFKLII